MDQKNPSVKKTDYAEAIEILKQDITILENMEVPIPELKAISLIIKAKETAISAMQELIQYQEKGLCLVSTEIYRNMCEELAGYRKIGSQEELRLVVEHQKPKRPTIKPWSPARCPTCGEELSEHMGDGYYRHRTFLDRCTNAECAQRLDWSDEE